MAPTTRSGNKPRETSSTKPASNARKAGSSASGGGKAKKEKAGQDNHRDEEDDDAEDRDGEEAEAAEDEAEGTSEPSTGSKRKKQDDTKGSEGKTGENQPSAKKHKKGGEQAGGSGLIKPTEPQQPFELTAPPPTRDDETKEFTFFESEPAERLLFHPNMSPEEILRAGAFGGSYFRPIHSNKLDKDFHDDWDDLPKEWYEGLDVAKYLTQPDYDPNVCRFKAKVGQTYEQWEDQGWVKYEHDVRGWFQWYCRFFRGRRCEDDERQIGRWKGIANPKSGRWRRILLNKYVDAGMTEVDPEKEEISPGIRQTLLHWAFNVTTAHLQMHREEKGLAPGGDEEGDEEHDENDQEYA